MDKELIKQNITLEQVVNYAGLKVTRKGSNNFVLCPFHDDHDPSLSFKETYYKCFACQKSGNVFSFIQGIYKCGFEEAKVIAKRISGVIDFEKLQPRPVEHKRQVKEKRQVQTNSVNREIYQYLFEILTLPDKCREYLKLERGFTEEIISRAKLRGLEDKRQATHIKTLLSNKYSSEQLKQSGLFTDKGFIFYQPSIITPFFHNDEIIYYQTRNLSGDSKCTKLTGIPEEFYFWNFNQAEIFVFEGIFDALSYYQITKKDNFIAVNRIIDIKAVEKIREMTPALLKLVFDNDTAGVNSRNQLNEKLTDSKVIFQPMKKMFLPDGTEANIKDFNDLLLFRQNHQNEHIQINDNTQPTVEKSSETLVSNPEKENIETDTDLNKENISRTCRIFDITSETLEQYLSLAVDTPEPMANTLRRKYRNMNIHDLKKSVTPNNNRNTAFIYDIVYRNPHLFELAE